MYIDVNIKHKAEKILRHFLLGSQIRGVRWIGSSIYIDIDTLNPSNTHEIILAVESRWTVFPSQPDLLPKHVEELPDLLLEEGVSMLARLANQRIVEVALGEEHPHLFLTFESGNVFFHWGYDEIGESWSLTSYGSPERENWLITAIPNDIAFDAPANENWFGQGNRRYF